MFVSKRLLILPLGLLITLAGCSGSRLQHIFAPDRNFMTLSELDEYEGIQRGPTSSSMVSRDADEKPEGRGMSDVAGWLLPKSENNDAFLSDPFLKDNHDTEVDRKHPIVTVELSKNLGEDTEQVIAKNKMGFPSATAPKIAATAEKTGKRSSESSTFADIMSEFEESANNLSSEPDIIDAMEEAWIENLPSESDSIDPMEEAWIENPPTESDIIDAVEEAWIENPPTESDIIDAVEEAWIENLPTESGSIDVMEEAWVEKQSTESQTASNCDTLMAEAIDDGSPKSQSSDDGLTLDFDMLSDEPSEEDDQVPTLDLTETIQEPEKTDELIQELAASEAFDSLEDSSPKLSNTADRFDSERANDESLWQASDSTIDFKSPDSDASADLNKSLPLSDLFTVGNRSLGSTTQAVNSSLQLPPIVQSSSAASSPARQPAIAQSFTNSDPQPLTIAHTQSHTLSDDPFLNDFATQAAAPVRETDVNMTAESGNRMTQNVSARTWLMLLGAIVIAYLLFAPENSKQSHQDNR
jgi:hypothetical protein